MTQPLTLSPAPFKFSICTLVTRPEEYAGMVESFAQAGFSTDDCEYLFISNANGNQHDAYSGYNHFLQAAQGEFIILCHQDIVLCHDRREILAQRIRELDALDPAWALLGNAGGTQRFGLPVLAIGISHPTGREKIGSFPLRVDSLDENFILARRAANLCLSHDLSGFHFYGTDLCQLAQMAGRTAYAVDFHLRHKSLGTFDETFFQARDRFIEKYRQQLKGRTILTTTGPVYLSGNSLASWWFNPSRRATWFQRIYRERKNSPPRQHKMWLEFGLGWYAFYWAHYKFTQPFIKIRRWLGSKIIGGQKTS